MRPDRLRPLALALLLVFTAAIALAGAIDTARLAAAQIVHSDGHRPPGAAAHSSSARLIVPVAGVASAALADTWGQARSEGRSHEGIDIFAPRNTAVLAAVDGRIVKFFDSARGGITIYEFDRGERFVYYYAHLNARAPTLREGDEVRQGDVIGFVGMTGNAPSPHLHFEIERLTLARHWWQAESINPYPLLLSGRIPS